jgi:hypothetical protein
MGFSARAADIALDQIQQRRASATSGKAAKKRD